MADFAVQLLAVVSAVAGVVACWAWVTHVRRVSRERVDAAELRIERLETRIDEIERELARQAVEVEEQGIRLETQSYWQED